jgi:hypothetical protein
MKELERILDNQIKCPWLKEGKYTPNDDMVCAMEICKVE